MLNVAEHSPTPSTSPVRERPRERISRLGAQALSDVELLTVILGSGTRARPVAQVARALHELLRQKPGTPEFSDICQVHGVGRAKAASLLAAFELARRAWSPDHVVVRQPADILPLVHDIRDRKQEHFVVVSLNGNHGVIRSTVVTVGLANLCQVHPREVFAGPITDRATAVVLAHNHPSGNTEPSEHDISVTKRLCGAADLLGIRVLDHVIFGSKGFKSIRTSHSHLFNSTQGSTGVHECATTYG